jgi:hypothetical protein
LVSALIPAGTAAQLINGFRYVGAGPVVLPAGHDYVIGALFSDALTDDMAFEVNNPTFVLNVSPAVEFGGYRYSTTFAFPDVYLAGEVGAFGPNFVYTVVPEQKPAHQNVLTQLEAIRPGVTNKIDAVRLDKAIRALAGSLTATNWIDDSHLARPVGKRIFANDTIATKLLVKLAASNRSGFDAADLQVWIYSLVLADRALAKTAISEASGDTTKAQAVVAEGDAAIAAGGHFEAIIQAYAKVWRLVAPK